ncbi:MAG: UDP-N-acetylmuramate dehydrogenase [Candidatus Nomurabacteria bacterium]|jgi:UDP-N-acetylmuramate dehydrogenase|nr:UDP-N-acetylmuramate dehydrogenase [Candidatus Nomurabacteria bacterium]
MKMLENVKISDLTTMRIGGKAELVVEVFDEKDVREAYEVAYERRLPAFVVGNGSNLIGRDEGFRGVIIKNEIGANFHCTTDGAKRQYLPDENGVFDVPSGVVMDEFIHAVAAEGWSGMEAMAKIPGTIGAAPVQNAGAYGQEIKDVLMSVRVYDVAKREFREISADECKLGYRRSIFNSGDDVYRYFITSVKVRLSREKLVPPFYNSLQKYLDENKITDFSPLKIYDAVAAVRSSKLPDVATEASAGSFFKNLNVNNEEKARLRGIGVEVWDESDGGKNTVPSGWLIENTGLKGKEFFGFVVSEKAALILINKNARSYADLEKARNAISEAVFAKYGVRLEQEPVEIKV